MYFKRFSFLVCIAALAVSSCSEEEVAAPDDGFATPTLKENVLMNLQKAYDEEATEAFSDLLDDFYSFCWDPPAEGTECFDAESVMFITGRFFEPGWYSVNDITVDRVIVKLTSSGGESGWIPSTTEKDSVIKLFEKVVDYELFVLQGETRVAVGTGRTTVFLVAKDSIFKIRGIFDHDGFWGALHRAYESAQ